MTSPIRTCAVATLAAAVLLGGWSGAEARGFRVRLGGFSRPAPSPAIATPRPPSMIVPVVAWQTGGAQASTPTTTGALDQEADGLRLRSVPMAEAAKQSAMPEPKAEPAQVAKAAEPWCRSGRVAGSGQGFCLIN